MQMSRPHFQSVHPHGGLTLVETLVALAVLGVIVALAAPSLADMMERRRVIAAAGELAGILNFAKSETNVLEETLTLHLEPMPANENSSCARLVVQSSLDLCGCDKPSSVACKIGSAKPLREFLLPKSTGVSFSASATSAGFPNLLVFARNTPLTGISGFGLTVTGARSGAQLRIEYNSVGSVSTCSPGGSTSGFPAC